MGPHLNIIKIVIVIVVDEIVLVLFVICLIFYVFLGHVDELVIFLLLHYFLIRRGLHKSLFVVEVLLL